VNLRSMEGEVFDDAYRHIPGKPLNRTLACHTPSYRHPRYNRHNPFKIVRYAMLEETFRRVHRMAKDQSFWSGMHVFLRRTVRGERSSRKSKRQLFLRLLCYTSAIFSGSFALSDVRAKSVSSASRSFLADHKQRRAASDAVLHCPVRTIPRSIIPSNSSMRWSALNLAKRFPS